jgi:large subunit ribosomal protein L25
MAETALKVLERTEKPQKARRGGFIPGAIFGEGIDRAISVKFELPQFEKILRNHAKNAKLQVKLGDTSRLCLVKEIQKDVISCKILHVDFQAVSENEVVKLKIPINYERVGMLEAKRLILLPNVVEMELEGLLSSLPESLNIDVGEKKAGDKIFLKDLKLGDNIKAHIDEDKILAIIVSPKEAVIESTDGEGTASEDKTE